MILHDHREAIEFDLLAMGKNVDDLGTLELSWRDLRTLVRRWQRTAGTALFESVNGFEGWSAETQMLAHVIDALQGIDYNQVRIAGGKPRKPPPVERPWSKPQSLGSGAVPFDEIDEWMRSTWK